VWPFVATQFNDNSEDASVGATKLNLPGSPCHHVRISCREWAKAKTILVLDDDVLVRMPVVQFLRDCGYHVVEAATIDEAIAPRALPPLVQTALVHGAATPSFGLS
jgi:hypothetical protein